MLYQPKYFKVYELVCPKVYNKFGFIALQFFDEKLLVTIDWIRETLNKPIIINNWFSGGNFDERGLRCIQCSIVRDKCLSGQVYVSPHILGKAVDFDVEGMKAEEVRKWLILNRDSIPYPIRLENNVSWVHLDVEDNGTKIYLFKP